MYRYLAMAWDVEDAPAGLLAHSHARRLRTVDLSWRCVMETGGLIVLDAGAREGGLQAVLLNGNGVVLGRLFRRPAPDDPGAADAMLDDGAIDRIVITQGRSVVDEHWGRYVALIRRSARELYVVRDPTGAMPCHLAHHGGVEILFSHLEDYLQLDTALSINWRHIGAFLQFDRVVSADTGFNEVTLLRAGECARIDARAVTRSFYWHPVRVIDEGAVEDPGAALQLLRNSVRSSVRSWGNCYRCVLHELSGGLDSSIVLACLAGVRADPKVICCNVYTDEPEGDERIFARLAAASANCELQERPLRAASVGPERMVNVANLASPTQSTFHSVNEELRTRMVRERHIEAIFSGQGGDHLFQRAVSSHVPAEYFGRHGADAAFLRVVSQTARATRKSFWSVLRGAIRIGLSTRRADPYATIDTPAFLRTDVGEIVRREDIRHPWASDARDIPAAKREQIFFLVDCQILYGLICRYADIVHPLISQPVIECCLRIPSYVLTRGGRDRGLARTAFEGAVPGEITRRTTKGGATGYFHNSIMRNAHCMRELLLDGVLVSERILDRKLLEAALSERQLVRGDQIIHLLTALRAEAWLRHARENRQRVAARAASSESAEHIVSERPVALGSVAQHTAGCVPGRDWEVSSTGDIFPNRMRNDTALACQLERRPRTTPDARGDDRYEPPVGR